MAASGCCSVRGPGCPGRTPSARDPAPLEVALLVGWSRRPSKRASLLCGVSSELVLTPGLPVRKTPFGRPQCGRRQGQVASTLQVPLKVTWEGSCPSPGEPSTFWRPPVSGREPPVWWLGGCAVAGLPHVCQSTFAQGPGHGRPAGLCGLRVAGRPSKAVAQAACAGRTLLGRHCGWVSAFPCFSWSVSRLSRAAEAEEATCWCRVG